MKSSTLQGSFDVFKASEFHGKTAAILATRFANAETGEAYPSKATLAAAVGRSERMVQIAIREMENAGWLAVSRGRGRGRSSTYSLAFPAGCEPEKRGNVVPPFRGARAA